MPREWAGLLLGLVFLACAGPGGGTLGSQRGDLRRDYPAERYLLGEGEGKSLEIARRRAAMEISLQLRGSLHAEGWVEAETGLERGSRFEKERAGETIHVETELARMEWIEVVSARSRGDRVEVVAVLDRKQVADRLRAEIDARSSAIERELLQAERTRGVLAQARLLSALESERAQLLDMMEQWAAISRRPAFRPEAILALERLRANLRARLAELEWEICLDGGSGSALPSAFSGRLAREGLKTRGCGDPPSEAERWRLSGELSASVQRMENPGGFPFFCTTLLNYSIEGHQEVLEAGGMAQGRRSGARVVEEACTLSLEELVADFLRGIGWAGTRSGGVGAGR